jgi:uncharacterized protein (TIGR03086 family)
MDPIANLDKSFGIAEGVISGVKADKWESQSPCVEWDARSLANHMVGGALMLQVCVSGGEMSGEMPADLLGGDPAGEYRKAADAALAAFRADPSVLDRTVVMPFGEFPGAVVAQLFCVDHFVHAWDLARATGQSTSLDAGMADELNTLCQDLVGDAHRGPGIFDAPTEAPADASAEDKLAAYLGRRL